MGVSPFPYGRVWFKNVHARIVYELETYYSFFFETSEYQSIRFGYAHFAGHHVCHREFRYRIFLCIVLLFFSLALQIGKFCVVNRLHA